MNAPAEHGPWNFRMRLWYSRLGVWLSRPLRCKFGAHTWDEHNWGFGGAEIDWFCRHCQKQIGSTPLDDAAPEDFERVAAAQRILGWLHAED